VTRDGQAILGAASVSALASRVGWTLAALGDRYGATWLLYNPVVMRWYHRHALINAPPFMSALRETFPDARRYLDIGAGTGGFAAEASRRGLVVEACELTRVGRAMARRQGVIARPFDLTRDPPAETDANFDLAYCIEVAEHLEPELGERLVRFAAARAPLVVFTAAAPGQGGLGHVNEQPKSYWVAAFARAGMRARGDLAMALVTASRASGVLAPWLLDNVMVFDRSGAGHAVGPIPPSRDRSQPARGVSEEPGVQRSDDGDVTE
jgi:SAM-dependent methyltransferase